MTASALGTVLYLGGARSGKSLAAERRVGAGPATYVATAAAYPLDPEWQHRLARHRERRPEKWDTLETQDLAGVISEASAQRPVLIDCLTLWLTNLLDDNQAWAQSAIDVEDLVDRESAPVLKELARTAGSVVLISNEVGSGIVPETPSGRMFRDQLGRLNAQVAAACTEVNLVVAGCVVPVKSPKAP